MLTPFQLFAVGLVTGTGLQLGGLWLCRLCRQRRRPRLARFARLCWLAGVAALLLVAVHDRDATLFAGQALAVWGFWKNGLLDVA